MIKGLWIKEIESASSQPNEDNMINIPIAEERSESDNDSFELEITANRKSTGKYKFKKSDMKSLLIGI